MWWKWCSGVSHGGSEFFPALSSAQLLRILRGGLLVHGKVAAPFGMAFPGSAQRSADTAGAVSSHAPPNALYCQEHNMKSVHAPLTWRGEIISPL